MDVYVEVKYLANREYNLRTCGCRVAMYLRLSLVPNVWSSIIHHVSQYYRANQLNTSH